MRPATRSVAKEPGGRLIGSESRDEVPHAVQAQHIVDAGESRQQVRDGLQVEIHSDSSSFASEDGGGDEGGLVDQEASQSHLLQAVGSVADQVFDGMPQPAPAAVGKFQKPDSAAVGNIQGPVSAAEGTLKGDGMVKRAPWVNLFKDNRNLGKGIKLAVVDSAEDIIQIEEDDVDDVEEAWGCCLVGQFSGRFPGMAAVRTIREGWKVKCKQWIHRSGWIIFKFDSQEDRLSVLNGGPYFIYGRNLMLKNMPKCFRFGAEEIAIVPVWVQLPDLPLDCWNARALSKIASRVGKPITTDKLTHSKERLSFARVLVEVDASKELVNSVEMRLPTGDLYEQSVIFEYIPKYCKKCKSFRHGDGDCNIVLEGRKHSAYVPKRVERPAAVTVNKKGDGSGSMRDAEVPSRLAAQGVTLKESRGGGVPLGEVLTGASKHIQQVPEPVLLPENSKLAEKNFPLPGTSGLRPAEARPRPDAGLPPDGAKVRNKGKHKTAQDDEAGQCAVVGLQQEDVAKIFLPSVGGASVQIKEPNSVGGKGPELRSDAADSLLSEDEGHGSLPSVDGSSIHIREPITVGGREKEAVVVTQGRQAVVREHRKLTAKGLSFASVSKGKAKGKSLQSSK